MKRPFRQWLDMTSVAIAAALAAGCSGDAPSIPQTMQVASTQSFVTGSTDQTLCVWSPRQDTPLFSVFVCGQDWIAWTVEGYYAASACGGGKDQMDEGMQQHGAQFIDDEEAAEAPPAN